MKSSQSSLCTRLLPFIPKCISVKHATFLNIHYHFFITGGFNTLTQTSFISALRALPAVVIGGLDSIPGAVVGSLIIGLTQGYVAYYQINIENLVGFSLGSGFSLIAPYLIMFFILLIRPDGLFGREEVERV